MRYEADAEIWVFHTGAWHFVTLPATFTEGIKALREHGLTVRPLQEYHPRR